MDRKVFISWVFSGVLGPIFILGMLGNTKPEKGQKENVVVVLSLRASGGHDSAAKAIKKSLEENFSVPTRIEYIDDYDYFGASRMYDNMMTTSRGRNLINFICRSYWNNAEDYTYFAYRLFAGSVMSKYNPICVISVVPFTYKVLKHIKNSKKVPVFMVPTDMYNVHRKYWISGDEAIYVLGSQQLIEAAKDKKDKHRVSGMLLRPSFLNDIKGRKERRQELKISDDRPLVTAVFGASASDQMEELMQTISKTKLDKKYNFAFITGKNKNLKKKLENMKEKDKIDCIIRGFEKDMHIWMQASKILIGKPGPGVISECHSSSLPMILITKDMLEQEKGNLEFVKDTAICLEDISKIESSLSFIIRNYSKYEAIFNKMPKNNTANEISKIVINKCFAEIEDGDLKKLPSSRNRENFKNINPLKSNLITNVKLLKT